jgi:acyl carrier protein
MKDTEIQENLLNFISRNFLTPKEEIVLDKSLVDAGIIDSMGLIEIATFMENQFSFKVHENDMIRDNFGSIFKMVNYIIKKTNNG